MKLVFDINNVEVIEFGLGRDNANGRSFNAVQVDDEAQTALWEMVHKTWTSMKTAGENGPVEYQPSEKYAAQEYLFVTPTDDLDTAVRNLHDASNLPIDAAALADLEEISCYFARLTDSLGQRLTALRRAVHFKGVLRKRLLRVGTDSLTMVEDKIFKLDNDFDLLIDSEHTHIWRPTAFESLCDLRQVILDAVPRNVASIQKDMGFMDLGTIEKFASKRTRAARHIASIRKQDLAGITVEALEGLCRNTGVEIEKINGKVTVAEPNVMDFLEVLDRRRYQVELVPGVPERFRAASRRKIST